MDARPGWERSAGVLCGSGPPATPAQARAARAPGPAAQTKEPAPAPGPPPLPCPAPPLGETGTSEGQRGRLLLLLLQTAGRQLVCLRGGAGPHRSCADPEPATTPPARPRAPQVRPGSGAGPWRRAPWRARCRPEGGGGRARAGRRAGRGRGRDTCGGGGGEPRRPGL